MKPLMRFTAKDLLRLNVATFLVYVLSIYAFVSLALVAIPFTLANFYTTMSVMALVSAMALRRSVFNDFRNIHFC